MLTINCVTRIKQLDELYYTCNTVPAGILFKRVPLQNGGMETESAQVITFEGFKTEDGKPIYQQILEFIKRGAAAGTIADGDELPSRRVLSALLGINPNTVQKAFRLLEDEGLIESRAGSGSFMTLTPEHVERIKVELLTADIRGLTQALKRTGVSRQEALRLIDMYWDDPAEAGTDTIGGADAAQSKEVDGNEKA